MTRAVNTVGRYRSIEMESHILDAVFMLLSELKHIRERYSKPPHCTRSLCPQSDRVGVCRGSA